MEITKISFICTCHGTLMTTFVDRDFQDGSRGIPKNGLFRESSERNNTMIPSSLHHVTYSTSKPLLDFEYKKIDTSRLNVYLSTSETCAGAPVYTLFEEQETRKNFIDDIISELTHTCPTNTLLEDYGHYGEISHDTHESYKQRLLEKHVRKIQKTFRKKIIRRKSKSAEKSKSPMPQISKTKLMKYDNERVYSMIDKKYGIEYDDDDSVKLVMVVTRNTTDGCLSQEYVLLSNNLEDIIETVGKLGELSLKISKKFISILERNVIKVGKTKIILPSLTLYKLILFANFIVQEINGPSSTVPIHIYDLTCNTFDNLQPPYSEMYEIGRDLNPKELSVVHLIDHYLREKDLAYGGKKLKINLK